jgi:hypothetical protein
MQPPSLPSLLHLPRWRKGEGCCDAQGRPEGARGQRVGAESRRVLTPVQEPSEGLFLFFSNCILWLHLVSDLFFSSRYQDNYTVSWLDLDGRTDGDTETATTTSSTSAADALAVPANVRLRLSRQVIPDANIMVIPGTDLNQQPMFVNSKQYTSIINRRASEERWEQQVCSIFPYPLSHLFGLSDR